MKWILSQLLALMFCISLFLGSLHKLESYCLTLRRKIKTNINKNNKTNKETKVMPPADFESTSGGLLVFLDGAGRGGLSSILFFCFSFPVVMCFGLGLDSNIHICPTCSPSPQSTVLPLLSICAWRAPLIHPVVPNFD